MAAFADLALHKPIPLTEMGPSVSDSVIFSGVASAADILRGYPQGDAEIAGSSRADTARGLIHVPVVDPVDHQAWTEAHANGRPYEERPRGTVIAADLEGDTVPFQMVVHDQEAIRRIRSGEWPDVSVAYVADLGSTSHPDADFAQVGRKVRHLALVPRGRDPHAHIVRDAFSDGAPMTLAELKRKYPALYQRARAALGISRRAGVAMADAISIDKAIPLIQELMKDDIGKLVLHAIVNAPEEMAEIASGSEDEDPAAGNVDPAMNNQGMADALAKIATLQTDLAALRGKVEPIITRTAAADAALQDAALRERADRLAKALDAATIARPEGFDPTKPTAAMCDAANDLLIREMAGPRKRYAFTPGPQGDTWDPRTRARIPAPGATADAAPTFLPDEL
jgi:hypothetical protein